MLLSIIVPVYNVEIYLDECIKSLLDVSLEKKYEIILVNDGSKDNSPIICDRYANNYSNIKVIHQENQGLSMARNNGVENASGKFITFIDSDDIYESGTIKEIIDNLENDQFDLIFLQMSHFWIEANGNRIERTKYWLDKDSVNYKKRGEIIQYLASLNTFYASAGTKIIKKELFIKNNLYFKKNIYCEDIEWFLRLLKCSDFKSFKVIDRKYYYRQGRPNSITNKIKTQNVIDLFEIIKTNIDSLDELNKEEIAYFRIFIAFEMMILIYSLSKVNYRDIKYLIKEIKKYSTIMKYTNDKRVKLCFNAINIFGLKNTSMLMRKVRVRIKL